MGCARTSSFRRRTEERPTFAADVLAGLTRDAQAPAAEIFLRRRRLAAVRAHHRTAGILSDPLRDEHLARARAPTSRKLIPEGAALIEFGSGSSQEGAHPAARGAAARGLCAGRYLRRDARAGGGRAARRISPSSRCCRSTADITTAVRAAGGSRERAGARRLFPGLDHRQFRAARGGGFLRNAGAHSRRAARRSSSASI